MTGVSRLDRVRNEVVRARTGVRRELAARVDMEFCFSQKHIFPNTYQGIRSIRSPAKVGIGYL